MSTFKKKFREQHEMRESPYKEDRARFRDWKEDKRFEQERRAHRLRQLGKRVTGAR